MEAAVYVLCSVTALACSVLLLRGFQRRRVRLLLWCGLFFVAQALDNALLFVQLYSGIDMTAVRSVIALLGVSVLLYGLIFDTE